ncbi:hypothetical protein [Shewanella sp. KX20019]|nr:hypothetical protein [Shewanella sp. KX20019]
MSESVSNCCTVIEAAPIDWRQLELNLLHKGDNLTSYGRMGW